MRWQTDSTRDELIDALVERIDYCIRKSLCSTTDEWQEEIEGVLIDHQQ